MRASISERLIKTVLAEQTCKVLYDDKLPLELHIQSSRDKATWWVIQYSKGKKQRTRLGYYPTLKPTDVAKMLPSTLHQMRLGNQPEVNQLETCGQLLQWYRQRTMANSMKKHATRNLVATAIDAQLMPRFSSLAVVSLSKDIIDTALVMPLISDGLKASTIKKYWSVLKAAVADAVRLDKIAKNYMAGFKFTDHLQKAIKPKECAIRPGQLPEVLNQIAAAEPVPSMLAIFMLLHATRIGETRQLQWSHIDFISRLIVIPAELTKTGVTHVIPLTDLALELLTQYRELVGQRSVFVFTMRGRAISDDKAGEIVSQLSQGKWSSHDLRKCARTAWAELGIDYFIAERLLNHKPRNLDAVYIKTDGLEQRKKALTTYHENLKTKGLHTGILQAVTKSANTHASQAKQDNQPVFTAFHNGNTF